MENNATRTPLNEGTMPKRMQSLFDCMDDGVMIVEAGESLSCIYLSEKCCSMLGGSGKNEGTIADVLLIAHEDERAGVEATIRRAVEEEAPVSCEYQVKTNEGICHFQLRATRLSADFCGGCAVLCVLHDSTGQRRAEEGLKKGHAQLDVALGRMKAYLWEVDLEDASFHIWNSETKEYRSDLVLRPVPACFTEHNWVYPEFVEECNGFFDEMLQGKSEGQCACILRQIDSNRFSWVKMCYKMQFDENGKPYKAIGISERFPNILDEKSRFEQEEKLIEAVKDRLIAALKINITTDTIENLYIRGDSLVAKNQISACEDIFKENIRVMINDEDIARYCARMNPSILNASFEHGSDWSTTQYRRKDKFGNVKWVFASCLMMREPVNEDLYAFVYVMDKDYLKRCELALPCHIELDPATHLYTRKTAHAMMNCILKQQERTDALCALMIIDFEGLKSMIERISYSIGSRMIFSIARLIRLLLNKECVIGKEEEFRISVFIPHTPSCARAYETARELIDEVEQLREHASMREPINFSIGVAVAHCTGAQSTILYTRAIQACVYAMKSSEKHRVHVAKEMDADERTIAGVCALKELSEERALTQDENDAYTKCLAQLIYNESYADAIGEVLHIIGSYYAADKVSVIAVDADQNTAKQAHEWAIPGKESDTESLRRYDLEKVQRHKLAVEKRSLCIFEQDFAQNGEYLENGQYIVMPIVENEQVTGLLCLDNASAHMGETALITVLLPALVCAYNKCKKDHFAGKEELRLDRLTGLLDRDACMQFIRSANPETISTMGILFVDVNGLSIVNQEMGIDYGDNLIRFAASTVKGEFVQPEVYRYSGDEILVLCQNITHEVFTARCDNIRRIYDTVYPGRMSIGCTWADVDINIFKMIDHAVKLATISKQSYYLSEVHGSKHMQSEAIKLLMDYLEKRRFQVWFQPKANIFTGEIIGAEALVRLLDPQRGIVGPQEFIPVFERGHAIRELDFFVLDETLKTMQGWKDDHKAMIPVSVNYSRETLLDPSALETTLSIFNRYSIPQNMIEIEITESIGEMEHATIGRACGQFREHGFRLALDDFGSAYSSMAVLANVPFDSIKVDKSIINSIVTNKVSRSIVESTLRICNETGAGCVAEGVETAEQVEALLGVGCVQAQGYFYNKPMTAELFSQKCLKQERKENEKL